MKLRLAFCAVLATLVSASLDAAIPQRERDALLAVFNATNGPNWESKEGWGGPPGTECNWYAVSCDDAQTTVTRLILGFNNLKGTLPAAVADLENLVELNMDAASLSGPIPPELGRLTKLKELYLSLNELSGTIPPALGSLTNLMILQLGGNKLTGTIPDFSRLSQLNTLSLRINQLTGPIPSSLLQLSNLVDLELDFNKLDGPLPDFSNWTQLQILNLNDNQLTGSIPASIGQLRNLQMLNLGANKLSGSIPKEIGNLAQLTALLLYDDQLSGSIPDEIYTLRQLTILQLARNRLTGGISPAIGNLTALTELELTHNLLDGPIPSEIASLISLEELLLPDNQLTGTIPTNLDRLTNVRVIDLGSNNLSGTIPPSLGNLKNLEGLALYYDNLTGTIPSTLGSIAPLRGLNLSGNQLTGAIPDSLRNLSNLEELSLGSNQLSGTLPDWLFQLPKIDILILSNNAFTGPIPATMSSSTSLEGVDLGSNQLTGTIPGDIGKMLKLAYLTLGDNELTGAIPDSMWDLTQMVDLRLNSLHLSGTLSPRVGSLRKLQALLVGDNDLTGTIPTEISALTEVQYLSLGSNRFGGTIPRELGQLKNLQYLDLSANNLRGPIPSELTGMTALVDSGSDFGFNALFTSDGALAAFINRKQYGNDFAATQTITPTNIKVTQTTDRSAVVEWTPIAYLYDEGGYQVRASASPGANPVSIATTASKEITSITVRGLQPATTYFFAVSAVTHPHDFQRNLVISDPSASVSAPTGPRVIAPPDVVVTATPNGLIQIGGVPQNEDSFTLTNFGDTATAITLQKSEGDFFALTPETFTLGAGASQIVKVTSLPQPSGVRYGYVLPDGVGTSEDNIVTISLLSAPRAGGNAIAEALTSRVEVSGVPGSDSIGTVTFRNRGTAALTGILVADVPWIVPSSIDPITIDPGQSLLVRFKVIRSRRPEGQSDGALTGTLSLIYVGALPGNSEVHIDDTTPPAGVSITKVTVVDTSTLNVAPGTAPPLPQGELAYFIAGLTSKVSGASSLATDLHVVNAFGSTSINDVRLYYTPTAAAQTTVASLTALIPSLAVTLANVVSNVYGASNQSGSMEVRSADWRSLTVNAVLLRLSNGGTYAGDVPVFRSDRALRTNDKLYLTGLSQSATLHATLFLQEIAGTAARVRLEFLDGAGTALETREVQLAASASSEITDVPSNAVSMIVTNLTATPTGVLSYVRMSDDASGDTWSVVDWSRYYDFPRTEAVRVPVVEGSASASTGRRRAVKHSDAAARATTSLTLFNPTNADARAKLTNGSGASKEVVVRSRQTMTITDLASFVGGSTADSVTIEPTRGELAMTSRTSTPTSNGGGYGAAVPVVSARSGLRVGQEQIFSRLEDSAATSTNYGFIETGGAPMALRATLLISGIKFTAFVYRDFQIPAGGFVLVKDLVRSILGPSRDTDYRDLHDLKLQLDVTAGSGAILPFVTATDNATGDSVLRLQ
jgi:Leucine-rich repeat (LRR) protein